VEQEEKEEEEEELSVLELYLQDIPFVTGHGRPLDAGCPLKPCQMSLLLHQNKKKEIHQ
jgi:hypothetical protein